MQEYLDGVTNQHDAQDDLVCGCVHMNIETIYNLTTMFFICFYEHL